MKKIPLLFFFVVTCLQSFSQIIAVQHNGTTLIESRLDTAIAHASSGDTIYLPGQNYGYANGDLKFVINKKLTIIGCGYHPDSTSITGPTVISNPIDLNSGSEGTVITGISGTSIAVNVSDVYISRCTFFSMDFSSGISNVNIVENIFSSASGGNTTSANNSGYADINFSNNIIYNGVGAFYGAVFINNVIYSGTHLSNFIFKCKLSFCTFINNILLDNGPFAPIGTGAGECQFNADLIPKYNYFEKNIFSATLEVMSESTFSSTLVNNYYDVIPSTIFQNVNTSIPWNSTMDFHLHNNILLNTIGSDSTQVGIYGGSSAFKEGGIPFNPHYQYISVSPVQPNGTLNLNVKVAAQEN